MFSGIQVTERRPQDTRYEIRIQDWDRDTGRRTWNTGYKRVTGRRSLDLGYETWIQDTGYRLRDTRWRVWDA